MRKLLILALFLSSAAAHAQAIWVTPGLGYDGWPRAHHRQVPWMGGGAPVFQGYVIRRGPTVFWHRTCDQFGRCIVVTDGIEGSE